MPHYQGGEQYNMAANMPQGYAPGPANYANADQNFYQVQTVNSGVAVQNQGNPYFKQGVVGYRTQSPNMAGYHMAQGSGAMPGNMGFAVRASAQAQGNVVFNNQASQMQQMRFVGQAGNQTFELQQGMIGQMGQGQMPVQNPRFVGMYQNQAGVQVQTGGQNVTWYAESNMQQKVPAGAYGGGQQQTWTGHTMPPEAMANPNYGGPSPNGNANQVNMASGASHNSHSAMLTHMSNAHHHHHPQQGVTGYVQPQQPAQMHPSPHQQQGMGMHHMGSPPPVHQYKGEVMHAQHPQAQGFQSQAGPPVVSPSQAMTGPYPSHPQTVYCSGAGPKTMAGPHLDTSNTPNSNMGGEGLAYHPGDQPHPMHKNPQLSSRSSTASGTPCGTPLSSPLQSPTHSHTPLPSMQSLNQDLQTLQSSAVTLNIQSNSVVTQTASSHGVAMTTTYMTPVTQHAITTQSIPNAMHYPVGHPQSQYNAGMMHHPQQHLPRPTYPSRQRAPQHQPRMYHPSNTGVLISAQVPGGPHPGQCPSEHGDSGQGTVPLSHPKTEGELSNPSCSMAGEGQLVGCARNKGHSLSRSSSVSSQSEDKPDVCITVPFGWRRVIENGAIIYYRSVSTNSQHFPL